MLYFGRVCGQDKGQLEIWVGQHRGGTKSTLQTVEGLLLTRSPDKFLVFLVSFVRGFAIVGKFGTNLL